jgi:hypothetical protein
MHPVMVAVQVLEVEQAATEVQVRVARNRRLLYVHPDKATCPGGHEATVRVNEVRGCGLGSGGVYREQLVAHAAVCVKQESRVYRHSAAEAKVVSHLVCS